METLYRFVKTSERLPEKRHNYHVKISYQLDSLQGIWNTASLWNGEYWEHPTQHDSYTGKPQKANVVEWLEEIEAGRLKSIEEKDREIAELKRQLEKYETDRYDKDDFDGKRDPWDDLGKWARDNTF